MSSPDNRITLFPDLFCCGQEDCPAKDLEIVTIPIMYNMIKRNVMALTCAFHLILALQPLLGLTSIIDLLDTSCAKKKNV